MPNENEQSPVTGTRRRARECALQILFSLDGVPPSGGAPALDGVIDHYWAHVEPEAAKNAQVVEYASRLVHGVFEHLPEIDAAIQAKSRNWRLDRMVRIDRNVMRMATFELIYVLAVPLPVIVNEAIELASHFGTEESRVFVNGILGRMAEDFSAR